MSEQYMICKNKNWKLFGGGTFGNTAKIIWGNSCDDSEKNIYEKYLSGNGQLLIPGTTLTINCEITHQNYTSDGQLIGSNDSACGLFVASTINGVMNTRVELASDNSSCNNFAGTLAHEMGHNYAFLTNGSTSVESFNEAVGCQDTGEGNATFDESPVSDYGKTNCKEFLAEAIKAYSEDPCKLNVEKYERQYTWLTTHPDAPPYQDDERCTN